MKPKKKPTAKHSVRNTPLESLLKYIFAALLIFIPLYPKFPFLTIPGTYVAIRAEDFILSLLAIILAPILLRQFKVYLKNPVTKSILIFWLVGFVSVICGIYLTHTTQLSLGILHWARRIEYMLPFFAGLILAKNRDNLVFFLKLMILVALGVFLYGIAQLYFNAPVISTQNSEFSKGIALTLQPGVNLSSTFAGHYDLATYLIMTIVLFTAFLVALKKRFHQLLLITFLLILFWLQLKTGSRIAFGALVLSTGFVFLLAKKPLWVIPAFLVAFIGMANTPSIAGRFSSLLDVFRVESVRDKVKGVMDSKTFILIKPIYAQTSSTPTPQITRPPEELRPIQQDRSTSIRFDIEWPRALRALYKNPFLGTGYGSISLATDNDYLRALGEIGFLGFFSWLTILINIIASLVKGLKRKLESLDHHFILGSLGMITSFLIIATFIDVFEASKVATLFWMYTGLSVGVTLKKS